MVELRCSSKGPYLLIGCFVVTINCTVGALRKEGRNDMVGNAELLAPPRVCICMPHDLFDSELRLKFAVILPENHLS